MTKKEMFAQIIAMATNSQEATVTPEEVVTFCEHEIELLSHKAGSGSKPTKTQIENETHKQHILDILADAENPMTISDMMEDPRLAGLKNQRVSALVTQLKKSGEVIRTELKKKAYFSLADK